VPGKRSRGAAAPGARLRVTQVRSGIGHPGSHRATLRAIGLKHHQDVVVVADTPSMRGMLNLVRHLVVVTPVEEG
jgi:large subunit ribosomal protein L30